MILQARKVVINGNTLVTSSLVKEEVDTETFQRTDQVSIGDRASTSSLMSITFLFLPAHLLLHLFLLPLSK